MPDRRVVARKHTPDQKAILRKIAGVTKRLEACPALTAERNDLYIAGRDAGLIFAEMADAAHVSEVAVIRAAKRRADDTGVTITEPERRTRRSPLR